MGQGASGAAHSSQQPPPTAAARPPANATDSNSTTQWLQQKADNATQTLRVHTATARRVWARADVPAEGARVRARMRAQLAVLQRSPQESAIAIAAGSVCGAVLFASGRVGTSFLLQSLRVSSFNRAAATAGGALGMLACSSAATHGFMLTSTLVAERRGIEDWPWLPVPPSSPSFALLTGSVFLFSAAQFRLLGGRMRFWAPSDIIKPGTFARRSMPAPGNEYADQAMKRALALEGAKNGCHSCGGSRAWWGLGPPLNFIGDHIPPNKYAKLADISSGAVVPDRGRSSRPWWQSLFPFLPRARKTPQVFLPQCERCSLLQSNAVRMDRRTLVCPRSWRWYDVWMPWPVLVALLLLPAFQELGAKWTEEKKQAEKEERRSKGAWF